jgi:Sulfotransferase family
MAEEFIKADLRLVFVHIPKTGGTTLHHHFSAFFRPEEICPERFSNLQNYSIDELAQWRFFSGHFNADEIKRIPGPVFIVTVLRNPIERLLSHYYFWKRHSAQYIERLNLRGPQLTQSGTLAEFLRSTEPAIWTACNNRITRQLAGQIQARRGSGSIVDWQQDGTEMTDLQIVQRALDNLFFFDVVRDVSQLNEVYAIVAQIFGMAVLPELLRLNTRDQVDDERGPWVEEPMTPEIRSLLEENTRMDQMICQLALDHWQRKKLCMDK